MSIMKVTTNNYAVVTTVIAICFFTMATMIENTTRTEILRDWGILLTLLIPMKWVYSHKPIIKHFRLFGRRLTTKNSKLFGCYLYTFSIIIYLAIFAILLIYGYDTQFTVIDLNTIVLIFIVSYVVSIILSFISWVNID